MNEQEFHTIVEAGAMWTITAEKAKELLDADLIYKCESGHEGLLDGEIIYHCHADVKWQTVFERLYK